MCFVQVFDDGVPLQYVLLGLSIRGQACSVDVIGRVWQDKMTHWKQQFRGSIQSTGATCTTTLRVIRRLGSHGDTRDTIGTPDGTPTEHRRGNRRTPVKRNICLDFAPGTEGSFLSPPPTQLRLAPLARTNETKRFPGRGSRSTSDLTLQPPIHYSCPPSLTLEHVELFTIPVRAHEGAVA